MSPEELNLQLLKSCWSDLDVANIERLCREGADPNHIDRFSGWMPLHIVISRHWTDAVDRLVDLGADPNGGQRHSEHPTPLCRASWDGYFDIAVILLEKGADPNLHGAGCTPLSHALNWKNSYAFPGLLERKLRTLEVLLSGGADPNIPNAPNTDRRIRSLPLHWALDLGDEDAVRLLLHHGAEWDKAAMGYGPRWEAFRQTVALEMLVEPPKQDEENELLPLNF